MDGLFLPGADMPECGMAMVEDAAATKAWTKRAAAGTAAVAIRTVLQADRGRDAAREGRAGQGAWREPLDEPGLLVHVAASLPIFSESVALCRAAMSWGGLLLFIRFDAGGAWCVVSLST
ncbi:hypothetical protein O4J55_19145 [Paracoccus sp. PXZ]